MKLLRLWLLVLLAVLLPVRGALGAAMVCAPAVQAPSSVATNADHAGHEAHHGDGEAVHQAGSGHETGHGQAHVDPSDKCNVCSASCSATPLLQDVPGVAEPFGLTATTYPDIAAAAPSFLSDGQERPPRSI